MSHAVQSPAAALSFVMTPVAGAEHPQGPSESWAPCTSCACVISDVVGPPTLPPRLPQWHTDSPSSSTEERRARSRWSPRESSDWHGHRRRALTIQEPCLLSSVAKGNFPLCVIYSDALILRWEATHSLLLKDKSMKSYDHICVCKATLTDLLSLSVLVLLEISACLKSTVCARTSCWFFL